MGGELQGELGVSGKLRHGKISGLKNGIYLGCSELGSPLGPTVGLRPSLLLPTPAGEGHLLCQALRGRAAQCQVPQRDQRHQGTAGTAVATGGTAGDKGTGVFGTDLRRKRKNFLRRKRRRRWARLDSCSRRCSRCSRRRNSDTTGSSGTPAGGGSPRRGRSSGGNGDCSGGWR